MKSKDPETRDARNKDPITGEPGSHPVGVGVGTTAGAVTGGALGAIGGPVGAAAGAVVGGIAGAIAGKAGGEAINPTVEDAYWREHHQEQDFADPDFTYDDDYAAAYRLGYTGRSRYEGEFDDSSEPLRSDWEESKGGSRLDRGRASSAARVAWLRAGRTREEAQGGSATPTDGPV